MNNEIIKNNVKKYIASKRKQVAQRSINDPEVQTLIRNTINYVVNMSNILDDAVESIEDGIHDTLLEDEVYEELDDDVQREVYESVRYDIKNELTKIF